MPCPNCGSHNLWDDNLAWGCFDCPWFTTGNVQNAPDSRDRFNEPQPTKAKPTKVANVTASSAPPSSSSDLIPDVLGAVADGVTTVAHGVGSVVGATAKGAVDVTCAIGEGIGEIIGGLLD